MPWGICINCDTIRVNMESGAGEPKTPGIERDLSGSIIISISRVGATNIDVLLFPTILNSMAPVRSRRRIRDSRD